MVVCKRFCFLIPLLFRGLLQKSIILGKREQSINTALENYTCFEIHILPASAIKINYPT